MLWLTACAPQIITEPPVAGILPVADNVQLPEVIKSLISQSDKLYLNNDYVGAVSTLERAVRINPRYAEVWSRMAQVYLTQGNLEQAKQHAKRSNSVVKDNSKLREFNNKIISGGSGEIQKDVLH
ncbi:MAG: tetratricopeptide repeat protein [Gammaproteobacteria bacterium]|nr:tetratricopeptide repeat protein [Gammaproteobacteria bacterium]